MDEKKLYAAPMEGLSTYLWRQVHRALFGGADKYYTPFLSPNANLCFQPRELLEITQGEEDLVPQLLANRGEYFLWAGRELRALGFREINLNLGCPSATVTAKRKGSGMLGDLDALERILDEVFAGLPGMRLSIKTRIGRYDPAEWEAILRLFEKYSLWELTVHPRVQKEFYKGRAHRDVFLATAEKTALPLVYNGDVTAPADEALTWGCPVMLGRGLMADPALLRRCRGGPPASRRELREYHDRLLAAYTETLFGDTPVLHKMRLLWSYLGASFPGSERYVRAICKAKDLSAYRTAAEAILTGCPLRDGS